MPKLISKPFEAAPILARVQSELWQLGLEYREMEASNQELEESVTTLTEEVEKLTEAVEDLTKAMREALIIHEGSKGLTN